MQDFRKSVYKSSSPRGILVGLLGGIKGKYLIKLSRP